MSELEVDRLCFSQFRPKPKLAAGHPTETETKIRLIASVSNW